METRNPSETGPRPAPYRFGDVEIDPARGYIRRGGTDAYLRVQSFQVLVYLLEHRDRLVSKEELHQAIWKDVAVGDDAIVQCIADVRRALGDSSRAPRYIKTVPKIGYRFVAELEEHSEGNTQPEVVTTRPPIAPSAIAPVLDSARTREYGPWRWGGLAAALVVAVVGSLALLAGGLHRDAPATGSRSGATRRLAVLYFDNQSGAADLAWLRHGLADMVITDLSRFDGVAVLSRQELDAVMKRGGIDAAQPITLEGALEVGRRTASDVLVLGSFAAIGGKVRLEVRLHDAASGRLLSADPALADTPAQVLTQVDVLALRLASRLGISSSQRTAGGIATVMTDNLEAYRLYTLGLERSNALRMTDAIAYFQKAAELDPGFAMAYARIGYTYAITHASRDRAKPFLEKAFQQSARLTERDRLQIAAWYAIASQDYDDAIERCRAILAHYPSETETYWHLANLLRGEGRLAEARDVLLQGLAIDPEHKQLVNTLGLTYSTLGNHAESIATLQRYVALAPQEANAYDSLGMSYQWAGRYDDAIAAYSRAIALDPAFEVPVVHLGNVYFQLGRFRDALRQYDRFLSMAVLEGDVARGHDLRALVHLALGDRTAAETELRSAGRHGTSGVAFLMALDDGDRGAVASRFRSLDRRLPNRGAGVSRRDEEYRRGRYALFEGRTDDAFTHFKAALAQPPLTFSVDSMEDCLADAYYHTGRFAEAVAEYERVLRLNPNMPEARLGLARSLDRLGQFSRARGEYQKFLEIWQRADADAPALIEARGRLAELHARASSTPPMERARR